MLLQDKTVAILGAGPVGLTMARLLQQQGVAVTVYERDASAQARVWGGTLDLHQETGQPALRAAGLLADYFAQARPIGRTLVDAQCRVQLTTPPNTATPEINRYALRQLLLGSLAPGTVQWGHKFTRLESRAGNWQLHFEGGPEATADVVIGANGGLSQARHFVTDAQAAYTGTFIVQGEVTEPARACPNFYQRCGGNILMYAHQGRTLVAHPDNNGALTYNVSFRQPADWLRDSAPDFGQPAQARAFLAALFADGPACFQELFAASTFFVGLPARQLSLAQPWHAARPALITLIGDAAHVMPPFAGEGANTGLRDARLLADNLTRPGAFVSLEAAIADYEQQMRTYAQAAQAQTSRNELAMHQPDFSFLARFGR
ncbi:FAD-dependent monooxygenase [Hymenobacter sp. RP-2-7]|uniref:Flavin-dependent monooxygenase n=1 Tax=Hymenobacter polaris TaxID=2682546 RepID=A0A7Y0FLU7_9BACT|nr:NAD(P)/FAD-dependent oxidoreductase [Hymenobacter polaris]NML65187.1 FAD-dependent monooxygenase [Hymenobacter polaris]